MANPALSASGAAPVNLSSLIFPTSTSVVRATKPKWLKRNTVATVTREPNEDFVDIKGEDLRSRTVTALKQRTPRKPKSSVKKVPTKKPVKKVPPKKPTKKPVKKNNKNNKRK